VTRRRAAQRKRWLHPILLALVIPGTACGAGSPPSGDTPQSSGSTTPAQTPPAAPAGRGAVAARVNGAPIYKIDLEGALASFMQANQLGADAAEERKQEARKKVLDGLIGSELLFQKARSIPIEIPQAAVDEAIRQSRASMGEDGFNTELQRRGMTPQDLEQLVRQNLMVQKMIEERIVNTIQVSDAESRKFYDDNPPKMEKPAGVDASHILVKSFASDAQEKKDQARKKIDEAHAKVKSGEEFSSVAGQYSEDASAARGGALGTIRRGQTVPAFEEAAFKLGVGQISDIVQTEFGFHVIKVTGKQEASTASFDEVKERVTDFLKQQKAQQAIESLVDSLRSEAKVEITG